MIALAVLLLELFQTVAVDYLGECSLGVREEARAPAPNSTLELVRRPDAGLLSGP